ncbi:MAG TPA: site-2 protease family protein [Gammaproteobacteria bacterium]|nr:site-2 protease family protein [Gammaproteobacteria bacterium]
MDALDVVAIAVPAVFAVTVHEVAHGWTAKQLGDPTAADLGRLTLNPLKHVDLLGTVLVPLALKLLGSPFLFGWAKPVPVVWRNLRHLRRDIALVAAAGPAANLAMLVGWALLLASPAARVPFVADMGWTGVVFNATIMTLNLIPIPPLDGSRLVTAALPARLAVAYNRLERVGLVLIAVLLMSGLLAWLMEPVLVWADRLVSWLAA